MKTTDKKLFTIKNIPTELEKENLMNEFEGGKKTTLAQILNEHMNLNLVK